MYFITFNLISWNSYKICKKKTSTIKKKWIQKRINLLLTEYIFSKKSTKPEAWNFIKKEALAQLFSCEFSEISKNTFFPEHLWTTASAG